MEHLIKLIKLFLEKKEQGLFTAYQPYDMQPCTYPSEKSCINEYLSAQYKTYSFV